MSYVKHVLQPDERLMDLGRVHWIVFDKAILCLVLACAAGGVALAYPAYQLAAYIAAGVFAALMLLFAIPAWWRRLTTEIAVTTSRVIYKTGFITRHTTEMNMDKVESVVVDQSLLGRLLGYGTIHIRGTGVGIENLRTIAAPIALRNAIVAR